MNIHHLDGCAPAPLAHYLKALGILRLVAEQTDPDARGWWEGDHFRLATKLDRAGLEEFFLKFYKPTPVVDPWNKGSGFYYENDPALKSFESSDSQRVCKVKEAIRASRVLLSESVNADTVVRQIKKEGKVTKEDRARLRKEMGVHEDKGSRLTKEQRFELKRREALLLKAKKAYSEGDEYKRKLAEAERIYKQQKATLIPRLRLLWRGPHLKWMDAAIVVGSDGTARFPALLGTGGNDGNFDFTNNFFQRFGEVFDLTSPECEPRPGARSWINGALWGMPVNGCQRGNPVGQYLPGMAGGANSTAGPDGNSLLNPLDFLLMIEGTILFTSHASRRLGTNEQSHATAPFAVSSLAAGYSSAASSDEGSRGEQWMPIWSQPLTLSELRRLLAEGRVQLGKGCARDSLDLARSVARLGSARGIRSFERYGYVERNGKSNLAVPLGRFRVPDRNLPFVSVLDDIEAWHARLIIQVRSKTASNSLKSADRRLSDALFAVTQHADEPLRWQAVLLAFADVESVMRTGSGFRAGVVPPLRPEWIEAANDDSPEFRLALTFALQSPKDPVRRHWLPLKENQARFAASGTGSQAVLEKRPEVVMGGRSGMDDAIAVVLRRIQEAGRMSDEGFSLVPAKGASAASSDLAMLLAGRVNLDLTMNLARALMALDRRQWAAKPMPLKSLKDHTYPDDAWLMIRLSLSGYPLPPEDRRVPLDPAIVRRLQTGDAASAVKTALQRLRSVGISGPVRFAAVSPKIARLWAAALAFPVDKITAAGFIRRLTTTH